MDDGFHIRRQSRRTGVCNLFFLNQILEEPRRQSISTGLRSSAYVWWKERLYWSRPMLYLQIFFSIRMSSHREGIVILFYRMNRCAVRWKVALAPALNLECMQ